MDDGILEINRLIARSETKDMRREESTSGRSRKEAALAALYDEYYERIARYIFVRLRDWAEAEDLAGEVFLRALESLNSYKERGIPMQSWLFKIAHNMVVDRFRNAAKRTTVPIDNVQITAESDLEGIAEVNIELARVTRAMEQLTPVQRHVIELRFFGGLTSEETGQVLKKRAGAVRELQSAAIRRLRKLLHEESPVERGAI